jgi:hypothetical protein
VFACMVYVILRVNGLISDEPEEINESIAARASMTLRPSEYISPIYPGPDGRRSAGSRTDPSSNPSTEVRPLSDSILGRLSQSAVSQEQQQRVLSSQSNLNTSRGSFFNWLFRPPTSSPSSSTNHAGVNVSQHSQVSNSPRIQMMTPEEEALMMTRTQIYLGVFSLESLCSQIASFL